MSTYPLNWNRQVYLETDWDVDNITLKGLRFDFTVEKSAVGYPNLANIKIYNLNQDHREYLANNLSPILFYVGHGEDITSAKLLFKGTIINCFNRKEGVDWITDIYARDGGLELDAAVIADTIPAGSTPEQMFSQLISAVPNTIASSISKIGNCINPKGDSLLYQFSEMYDKNISVVGNVKAWLLKLAHDCGFDWHISEGVAEATPKDAPIIDETPLVTISQNTGMIGMPERTNVGIIARHLLLPELKVFRRIKIEHISETINVGNLYFLDVKTLPLPTDGIYRINKVIHTGDTHTDTWQTEIHAGIFNNVAA